MLIVRVFLEIEDVSFEPCASILERKTTIQVLYSQAGTHLPPP